MLDRADHCINLVEIKFSNKEFVIDKQYAHELEQKVRVFTEKSATKKTVFLTMLTSFGVKKNDYYLQNVQKELTMEVLFE